MRFLLHLITGILTLFLATKFVEGVKFEGPFFIFPDNLNKLDQFFDSLVFAGIFLGFLNFFLKPILNLITLPLRIITFGLFGFLINLFLVWLTDLIFPKLNIAGIFPLIITTLILSVLNLLIFAFLIRLLRK